jgi:hypothetical protein
VLPGPCVSAALPRPPAPSCCPPGPIVARPHLSAAAAVLLVPRCPPLLRGNAAARARRPRADAGRLSHPPPCLGPLPPLSFPFLPSMGRPPSDPLPPSFPSVVRPSVFKRRRSSSCSPHRSAPSRLRSSTPPPPPSFPELARRPRTPGPRFSTRFPLRRHRRLPSPMSR